jgi:hypothetical protein
MPKATVYFVVLKSDQYPGLNGDVYNTPFFSRERAERAADNARARCAAYERIEVLAEEHDFLEDPTFFGEADCHCLCCGLTKPKRPALPPWMTPAKS